jgi:TonB family protein
VNKFLTTERLSRLLAFTLSGLLYLAAVALVLFWMRNRPAPQFAFNPAPVNLSFAQVELQAAAEPLPVVESEPEPPPPEEIEIVTEQVVTPPEPFPEPPEPEPEPVKQEAQVTQQASAPDVMPADPNRLIAWVQAQIEKEKYYPPAARNAGLEGQFRLQITIGTDGKIAGIIVLDGQGHPMLRRALEKFTSVLVGRSFGQPLPAPYTFIQPFAFELN